MKKKVSVCMAAAALFGIGMIGFNSAHEVKADADEKSAYPGFSRKDLASEKDTVCNKAYTSKNSIVCKSKSWTMKITAVKATNVKYTNSNEIIPQISLYGTFTNNTRHKLGDEDGFFGTHFRVYQVLKNNKKHVLSPSIYNGEVVGSDVKSGYREHVGYLLPHKSQKFMVTADEPKALFKGQKIVVQAYNIKSYFNKKHAKSKKLASKTFRLSKVNSEYAYNGD